MRVWSVHPHYLDAAGLVALWRETLLMQHVLLGKTKGYQHHPQLERFRAYKKPVAAVGLYLKHVCDEADRRGYKFDRMKISITPSRFLRIPVTSGQLAYEWKHLKRKLKARNPEKYEEICNVALPEPHPLFSVIEGGIESWERV